MNDYKYHPCPCCGYLTIPDDGTFPGSYFTCPVCFWEDDDIQYDDPNYRGGANRVSLNEARENYKKFGAKEERLIKQARPPLPDEIP